ncbi:LysE family translocator [Chitinimonas koreensis]|uniref:LysE family translocator n=1 Tax=Chitinimonas koreensis TaxID=356302 RepID=UPI0003FF9DBF|nr:LysE family translocator [Chitinimonas koreensis]QNM95626.1 LysE family translocator [Chitinimonas koreensis]
MLGTHDLALFIASGLLLNITPGPDSLYIASRAASQGFRAGSAAALGIGAGTLVHVLAAAFGLSALLAASSMAFTAVKLAGAAYLVWIGLSLLRSRAAAADEPARLAAAPLATIFWQGFWTNVLNPKVALFFLAFVPQFIDPAAPSKALAFVFLGAVFDFNGMLWCHLLAFMAAGAGRRFKASARTAAWLNRGVGAVFLFLGIKLAFARPA